MYHENVYNNLCGRGGCCLGNISSYYDRDGKEEIFVPDFEKYDEAKAYVRGFIEGKYDEVSREESYKSLVDSLKYIVAFDAYRRNPFVDINDLYKEIKDVDVEFGKDLGQGVYGVTKFSVEEDIKEGYAANNANSVPLSYVDREVLDYIRRIMELSEEQYHSMTSNASCDNIISKPVSKDSNVEVKGIEISKYAEEDNTTLVQVLTHELQHVLQKYHIPHENRDCLEADAEFNTARIYREIVDNGLGQNNYYLN